MKKPTSLLFLLQILLYVSLLSCSDNNITIPENEYTYSVPEELSDGWQTASLSEVGIDTEQIELVTSKIQNNDFKGIHSLMIVKNGLLVHEAYFKEYKRNSLQHIFSITKSVSSALIGIAIDNGFISDVDRPVLSLMPEYLNDITDEKVNQITLKHILTLSTGFEWDEHTYPYEDIRNSELQMFESPDWMKFVLSLPVIDDPGTKYVYNTGSVHLLSAIIKNTTGLLPDQFAEENIFNPLNIASYEWNRDNRGFQCTGATHGGLKLTVRDLAKFGQLFLRKGLWNGKQVISEEWVNESTTPNINVGNDRDVGYLWWMSNYNINGKTIEYTASYGFGRQTLLLIPELDMMIILTCTSENEDAETALPILMIISASI